MRSGVHKVSAEIEERARSVRENLERTMNYPPVFKETRPVRTQAREHPVADLCATLEDQISETAAAAEAGRAKIDRATSADELQSLKAGVEFADLKLKALINERLAKEGDRLSEIADDARSSGEADNPMPALVEKRERLQRELDEVIFTIQSEESQQQRIFSEVHAAQAALDLWRAPRPAERAQRTRIERELRSRLESLGRSAFR